MKFSRMYSPYFPPQQPIVGMCVILIYRLIFLQVVSDSELSSLLLDTSFQQILKECNDPLMYSMHMRNPVTARKIKTMFNAGLVATVK